VTIVAAFPDLDRHLVGSRLRGHREASERSQRDVAASLGWSLSKLHRIEAGTTTVSEPDLRQLLEQYPAVPGPERSELLHLVTSARRPRSDRFRSTLPASGRRYLDYEGSAEEIWNFEPIFVPGLLQLPGYTRALLTETRPVPLSAPFVEQAVEVRDFRRQILSRDPAVRLRFLIDEAVLARPIGGSVVMRNQLEHLWALSERSTVSLGIMPLEAGGYAGMSTSFVLLRPAAATEVNVLFLEDQHATLINAEDGGPTAGLPERYRCAFEDSWARALTGAEAGSRLRAAWRACTGAA
jgi:transcriptional regulator with XRE-family HTH domain